jgi:hypothetical protein
MSVELVVCPPTAGTKATKSELSAADEADREQRQEEKNICSHIWQEKITNGNAYKV